MRRIAAALLLLVMAVVRPVRAAVVLSAGYTIATSPVEIGIGYDARGRERWRFTGTEDGQETMPDWMPRSIRGGTFTHNHVGEDHCVDLSVDDVQFGAYYHLAEIRAVGYEAGRVYVAIIEHPRWITTDQYNAAWNREAGKDWCTRGAAAWAALGVVFERVSE